jgi:response regulator RpfG family c-di-GMP phosphodiesterase
LQQHTALIEHVNQVSLKINSTLNLDAIFDSIAEYSRNLLTCQAVVVGVMARRGMVSFPSVAGVSVERREKLVDLSELPIIQKTFNEAQIIIVNGYDQNKHGLGMELPIEIRNFIVYPIVSKSNVAAVIIALNKEDGRGNLFTATDGELLKTLAGQAANAIENGRLLNNVTQTQITMMTKLAALAEKRDPETGEHLLRMQKYSRIIAQELAKTKQYASVIDERFVNDLYVASPLHDIGKVGISDNILLKPGKLTEEEFDIMRSHTTIGAEILLGPAYLEMAADIAHCHHERWDGSGYPRNLAGENIPLCSRIVTVADVYDALTSRRVYKECFSHEIAVQTLTEGRGTNFDPMVLDAFNAGLSNVLHIKNLIR